MPNILIQPIRYEEFYGNTSHGIPYFHKSEIESYVSEDVQTVLNSISDKMVYVWPISRSFSSNMLKFWDRLQNDDYIVFYDKDHPSCIGRIACKVSSSELGKAYWTSKSYRYFSYFLLVHDVMELDSSWNPEDCHLPSDYVFLDSEFIGDDNLIIKNSFLQIIQTISGSINSSNWQSESTEDSNENLESYFNQFDDSIDDIQDFMDGLEKKLATLKTENDFEASPIDVHRRVINAAVRNKKVSEWVKKRAGYRCEICGEPGFEKSDGGFYAEAHHLDEVAKFHIDDPNRMLCLCPTCHRTLHYGSRDAIENRFSRSWANKKLY